MPRSVVVCWARRVGKWLPQVQVSWKSDRRWAMKLVDHLLEQGFMSSRNSSSMAVRRLALLAAGSRRRRGENGLGSGDAHHSQSVSGNTWRSSQNAPGWLCDFPCVGASPGTKETKLPLELFRDGNIIPMSNPELTILGPWRPSSMAKLSWRAGSWFNSGYSELFMPFPTPPPSPVSRLLA